MRILTMAALCLLSAVQERPELDDKSSEKWLRYILPSEREDAWKDLGWRTEFGAGLAEAKKLERPILLWAMNGHPCGHT